MRKWSVYKHIDILLVMLIFLNFEVKGSLKGSIDIYKELNGDQLLAKYLSLASDDVTIIIEKSKAIIVHVLQFFLC